MESQSDLDLSQVLAAVHRMPQLRQCYRFSSRSSENSREKQERSLFTCRSADHSACSCGSAALARALFPTLQLSLRSMFSAILKNSIKRQLAFQDGVVLLGSSKRGNRKKSLRVHFSGNYQSPPFLSTCTACNPSPQQIRTGSWGGGGSGGGVEGRLPVTYSAAGILSLSWQCFLG